MGSVLASSSLGFGLDPLKIAMIAVIASPQTRRKEEEDQLWQRYRRMWYLDHGKREKRSMEDEVVFINRHSEVERRSLTYANSVEMAPINACSGN